MPPVGGRGGEDACREQGHTPATGHRGRDRDTPSRSSPPPFPSTEISSQKRQKHEYDDEQQQHPAASLPGGPIVEILSPVPYSSLCRLKCVSKPWLALCSDPDIRKRSLQTVAGFFFLCGIDNLQYFRNFSRRGPPLVDPSLPFLSESYQHVTIPSPTLLQMLEVMFQDKRIRSCCVQSCN